MESRTQGALMLAVGGVTVRLGLSDEAFTYVKPDYVPLQVIAGIILLALGAITLLRSMREEGAEPAADDAAHAAAQATEVEDVHPLVDEHGHDHDRGPRVAWMLAAPLFAILLVAPPPLGSFAANRQAGVIQSASSTYPPLPPAEAGAVPLSLGDYAVRALYDPDRSLEGERVRLMGFVSAHAVEGSGEGGWVLSRFAVACCAADATAINVEVVEGVGPPPPIDQWVTVEGTWRNRDGHEVGELTADPPLLVVEDVQLVEQPATPYEV